MEQSNKKHVFLQIFNCPPQKSWENIVSQDAIIYSLSTHTKALITSNCDGNALTTTCIRGETFLPGYSCIHKCSNWQETKYKDTKIPNAKWSHIEIYIRLCVA